MKFNKIIAGLILAGVIAISAGCLSSTPQVSTNPSTGQPVTNLVYSPAPQISQVQSNVNSFLPLAQAVIAATPAAPAAPFLPSLSDAVFGLITTGSLALSAYLNSRKNAAQASATQHASAAAALAAGIQAISATQPATAAQAITAATSAAQINGSTGTVAQHLQNAASPV